MQRLAEEFGFAVVRLVPDPDGSEPQQLRGSPRNAAVRLRRKVMGASKMDILSLIKATPLGMTFRATASLGIGQRPATTISSRIGV